MSNTLRPLLARLKANLIARKLGLDGGPGSGNFGHKGRPGMVGGSAPKGKGPGVGGGKQYRAYHPSIGYFGSRKDWLNGLSGEEQQSATKLLKSAKSNIPPTSDMTPEEYIMKEYPIEAKETLVDLVGKARSWEDTGIKLQIENLTNEEGVAMWVLAEALERRFGSEEKPFFTEKEILQNNFDRAIGLMSQEEKEFYLDMKAKACGLPNSGKKISEYSRAFQNEIGCLPEPKLPTTKEENKDWIAIIPKNDKEYKSIESIVEDTFGFKQKDPAGNMDMNDAEWTMFHKLGLSKRGLADHSFGEYATSFKDYLSMKDKLVEADYFNKISNPSPLWDEPGRIEMGLLKKNGVYGLKHALQEWGAGTGKELSKDGKELEDGFLGDNDVPDYAKSAYLALKSVALGNPLTNNDVEVAIHDLTTYTKSIRDLKRAKEAEAKKAKALKEYNELKKNNNVVIAGDELSEGVDKLRKDEGAYTHEEIHKVGSLVYTHYKKEYDRKHNATERLKRQMDEAWEEYSKAAKDVWNEPRGSKEREEKKAKSDELYKKYAKLRDKKEAAEEDEKKVISNILSRIRKTGLDDPKAMKEHFSNRSPNKKYVEEAYQRYPTEWIKASIKFGRVAIYKKARGCYSTSEIDLDGEGERIKQVATHELGHRFEEVVPGIRDAEKEFYERRTEGEPSVKLRTLTGNKGYRSDEVAKKDKFVNPYIGKDYKGSWYEVVSMGFQYAFNEPDKLMQDPDYARFILGMLAVA